jgi:hypothetical protein
MTKRPAAGQRGASALATLLLVAVIAYGVFIGIQWVPQHIESSTVDSVLESLEARHRTEPAASAREVGERIGSLLYINERSDLKERFKVRQEGRDFIVEVDYERELNLLFTRHSLRYQKSRRLR